MLSQLEFEHQGTISIIIGFLMFLGFVIGLIKGSHWLWTTVLRPAIDDLKLRRSLRRDTAFAEFKTDWLLNNEKAPVFILDGEKNCIFVNEALCDLLEIDSSQIEGRQWHRLVTESELSRVLAKWEESYTHKSVYTNISTLMVGRAHCKFLVKADPFIWRGKVINFIGTLEMME